ncbi:hypothetical protein [Arthrobacter sp. OY3WO11]|uniref:hypothetical protein n=1 Tax=Arthrobacter sp. OY3WO11 TaxID=1835723 RepID=UPI0007CF150F|nr:hypothetical protein [Arthrobacter sp. OY3WO11]OAE02329.1 hypothetical protein A6A22_13540 [Arthrobacter sp. OY3WO11]
MHNTQRQIESGLRRDEVDLRGRRVSRFLNRSLLTRLPTLAGLLLCALVLGALLINLVQPHYGVSRYNTGWTLAAAVAVLALMIGLYWLLLKAAPMAARHRKWMFVPWIVLWSLLFTVQMRVAYAVRLPADWDAYAIYGTASSLALGATESVGDYFQINPNNLLLTLLVAAYYELVLSLGFSDLPMASAFLNALVLFAGTVLTYCAARMLGGRKIAAFTLLPASIFLVVSPWAGVLYSDTVGVLFTASILCLLLAARRSPKNAVRIPLWIATGAVAAVGYGIKPTVLICLIAAGITAICLLPRRRNPAVLVVALIVVGGSFALSNHLITKAQQRSSAVNFDFETNPNGMNPGHFLKVGSRSTEGPHGPFYGAYNEEDYASTVAIVGEEEKLRAGLNEYTERVSEMGPLGYLSFLTHKLAWVTGDGSFFSWGEGRMNGDTFLSQDPKDRAIQDLFGNTRPHFQWLLSIWQGTWFVVLALVAVPLALRVPRLLRPEVTAMRIALLGLILFLLFFEARARFLYLYAPYFIVLASLSMQSIFEWRWWRSLRIDRLWDRPSYEVARKA